MASIRQLAGCIGLAGNISILADFLGFFRRTDGRPRFPTDPTGAAVQISLLRQVRLLKGPHFHLNVTAIGSDNFTNAERNQLDYSIFKIRNIYNQVGVGVGRVQYHNVKSADAKGLDAPTTEGQVEDISSTWTVPNDGIDVSVPFSMNVALGKGILLGKSALPGPCEDKDDKGMNGSVIGLWGSEQTARTFAHEVGHYLGLAHPCEPDWESVNPCAEAACPPNRLMTQSGCAANARTSVDLTIQEGNTIKGHCLVKPGC